MKDLKSLLGGTKDSEVCGPSKLGFGFQSRDLRSSVPPLGWKRCRVETLKLGHWRGETRTKGHFTRVSRSLPYHHCTPSLHSPAGGS